MTTMPTEGTQSRVVPATPAQVWKVLADPTRTGEWSHEARAVRWAPGSSTMEVGARFIGTSRVGRISWTCTCLVDAVVPCERLVWHTLLTWKWRENTEWEYGLTPVDGGTRIDTRVARSHPNRSDFCVESRTSRDRTALILRCSGHR